MKTKHSLSVIIPTYNEQKNIQAAITQVSSVLAQLKQQNKLASYEIIAVDDGSQDRSAEIIKKLTKTTPHYGGALKAGFNKASQDLIAWFPADLQFNFSEITQLLAKIDQADIVAGYRANRQDNLIRKFNAAGWNLTIRLLFGYLCRDVDCGFKLFKRDILSHIPKLTSERGGMIDPEFMSLARAAGYTITDVPLTHLPRKEGESTGANLKVIYNSFRDLFRLWFSLRNRLQQPLEPQE
jgi:glycosyltransferase involved in cell wall biosynthesis